MEDLKYPIGKFIKPEEISGFQIDEWIRDIEDFPRKLSEEVAGLNDTQLNTPYRPGGWTVRQVVHHCADSHINAYIRFKLALTEDNPVIKPYFEDRWAGLPDTTELPVIHSLQILEGLHRRWTYLLKSLNANDLKKTYIHPEHGKTFFLDEVIANYSWHSTHHLAHIRQLKKRMSWL